VLSYRGLNLQAFLAGSLVSVNVRDFVLSSGRSQVWALMALSESPGLLALIDYLTWYRSLYCPLGLCMTPPAWSSIPCSMRSLLA
jgi:hypothetical protein